MKCADRIFMQKYIDGEMDLNTMKLFDRHIIKCRECSSSFNEVKNANRMAQSKMKNYSDFLERNMHESKDRHARLEEVEGQAAAKLRKHSFTMKKGIAAACVMAVLLTSFAFQPVRQVIAETLQIFRMQQVKGINITAEDIDQIRRQLGQGNPDIFMENIGRIKLTEGVEKNVSTDEVKNEAGFKVKYPSAFSEATPHVTLISPTTLELNLNVRNINEMLDSLGGNNLLPPEIDGRTVALEIAQSVVIEYNISGVNYEIVQTSLPALQVSDDVDVDGIYASVLELPLLPDNLKRQLKSIKDWKSTIYVPLIETTGREVKINGYTGYLYTGNLKNTDIKSWLIWNENGVIRSIEGGTNSDNLLEIALSMR